MNSNAKRLYRQFFYEDESNERPRTMRFSIITVCFNAADTIEKTIESLIKQTCGDYEYIIKDGGSKDDTVELAKQLLDKAGIRANILTESDKGIFDAMNTAASVAQGDYIYFLNSGDEFSDSQVLEKVSAHIDEQRKNALSLPDIVFGNVYERFEGGMQIEGSNIEQPERNIEPKKSDTQQPESNIEQSEANRQQTEGKTVLRKYGMKNTKKWHYALGACLNHQTMFCRRELFADKPFDLEYRSNSDREWQMYHIIKKHCQVSYIDYPIAVYLRGGFSEQNLSLLEEETYSCVKKYCGGWIFLHNIIRMIKKSKLLHSMLTALEARINVK